MNPYRPSTVIVPPVGGTQIPQQKPKRRATQVYLYRYIIGQVRQAGGQREWVANLIPGPHLKGYIESGAFGNGRYRLEYRDRNRTMIRVQMVLVGEEAQRHRPRPRPRGLPARPPPRPVDWAPGRTHPSGAPAKPPMRSGNPLPPPSGPPKPAAPKALHAETAQCLPVLQRRQGATPPAPGATPPARGATPPTRGTTPPARGATPPARDATPPARGATPPARGAPATASAAATRSSTTPPTQGAPGPLAMHLTVDRQPEPPADRGDALLNARAMVTYLSTWGAWARRNRRPSSEQDSCDQVLMQWRAELQRLEREPRR